MAEKTPGRNPDQDNKVGINKAMSTIELIILGILQEKSMSAYELTQYVEQRQVERLLKISKPSIYKVCKKLYKEEYLSGETVREGENPEKIIYSITKKGKDYFYELMQHFSSRLQPFFFDFNCFIWNIEKAPKKKAVKMLLNLQGQLDMLKYGVERHEKEISGAPFSVRMIVKQYRMTIDSLVEWISEVIAEFKILNQRKRK